MIVTKILEWDMGHRIPNHKSICKNLHGHRYRVEISLEGNIINKKGDSSESMVIDFSDIKAIATKEIIDPLDHAFMYSQNDSILTSFFNNYPDFKTLKVEFIPTAEEIAKWLFLKLNKKYKTSFKSDLNLKSIKLWETPTSFAIFSNGDL